MVANTDKERFVLQMRNGVVSHPPAIVEVKYEAALLSGGKGECGWGILGKFCIPQVHNRGSLAVRPALDLERDRRPSPRVRRFPQMQFRRRRIRKDDLHTFDVQNQFYLHAASASTVRAAHYS